MLSKLFKLTSISLLLLLCESIPNFPTRTHNFQDKLKIFELASNKTLKIDADRLYEEGVKLYEQAQYRTALEKFTKVLEIYHQIDSPKGKRKTFDNLGEIYFKLGDYSQALNFYQQALTIEKQIGARQEQGRTVDDIGQVYSSLGQYAKALEFYQQALAIQEEINDRVGKGRTINNIGQVYFKLGQAAKALKFYEQSSLLQKQNEDLKGQAQTLDDIGQIYYHQKDYDRALEFYQQALAIQKQIGSRKNQGRIFDNIGQVYSKQKKYEDSLKFYQEALLIQQEIDDSKGQGRTLNNMGQVYEKLSQYDRALASYQQAFQIQEKIGDLQGQGSTLHDRGRVLFNKKQFGEAETMLRKAIEVLESLRSGLTDLDKVSIFEEQIETYQNLQSTLIAQNKVEEALEISERGRARAFVELLAAKISTTNATVKPPNLQEIKQIVRSHQSTVIEYSITEEELLIWVISPEGKIDFRSAKLSSLKTPLVNLVERSLEFLTLAGRRANNSSDSSKLKELHEILIQPIADLLPKTSQEKIIFIPQGFLFLVPFTALQNSSGQFLIERHTILTAPSIQILQLTAQQQKRITTKNKQSLVAGNPTMPSIEFFPGEGVQTLPALPGSEREAIDIAKLLATEAIVGNMATKGKVVKEMKQAKIIHLATHGLLYDFTGNGIPGAIALAPAAGDNGLLTADEIFDLKLQAELVVLSACNTGKGEIEWDGVLGLSRAFITAGVPSLIVSLWSIADSHTAELMVQFYQNLQNNPDRAKALRDAMLSIKQKYPEPYNWAAFTLIGETGFN
jgi:CHAT domain-containing protein